MPDLSDFAQIPYPTGPEAMDGPANMMAIVEAIDPNIVLHAVSIGDRDSKYGSLPPGSVVTTTQAPWYVWLRTVTNGVPGWVTVYEFTDWTEFPSSAWADGWSDVASRWHRHNGRIDFYLRASYNGDDIVGNPTNGGNISDLPVMTLPSQTRPILGQVPIAFLASTTGMLNVPVAGNVTVTHLSPGGTLSSGTVVTAAKDWRRG